MAVLSREDFFARMQERLGNDTSDSSIAFLEDMTDTYNDLEKRACGDGVNWQKKYEENDAAWKAKYQHRFFSGGGYSNTEISASEPEERDKAESITVDDLFKNKED